MESITKSLTREIIKKISEDPCLALFLETKNMSEDELIDKILNIMRRPSNTKKKEKIAVVKLESVEITKTLLLEMANIHYPTNWRPDYKHCIHRYGSRVKGDIRPFTYCSVELTEGQTLFCSEHVVGKKAQKVIEQYRAEDLDLKLYHDKLETSRKSFCDPKLKAMGCVGESLLSLVKRERMVVEEYAHDSSYYREKKNGLIVRPINENSYREYRTVGVDRRSTGNIKKLSRDDARIYSNANVIFDPESLDDSAKEYLGM